MNKHVMRLVEFAISKNRDGFHTFIDFSGHVESLYIRVHKNGWLAEADADLVETVYLRKVTDAYVKRMIEKINKLDDLGRKLLVDNELRKEEKIKLLEKQLAELKGA